MATKKTKSRTAKSALTKKHHFPLWSIILVVLLIASVGIYFVYNSFAATSTESSGYMNWNTSGSNKQSNTLSGARRICVFAYFNGYGVDGGLVKPQYKWRVQRLYNGIWTTLATSGYFQANGNQDKQCHTVNLSRAVRVRVQFDPSGVVSMKGNYSVGGQN